MHIPRFATATAILVLGTPAAAQDLFGVTSAGNLVRIDPANAVSPTTVGPMNLTIATRVGSLAYHPDSARIYGIGVLDLAGGDREYRLIEIDPGTGASTDIGLAMIASSAGHVESLSYVHSLQELVLSHSDGGINDFASNRYATIDRSTAQVTPLSGSTRDTDNSVYVPYSNVYYSLDPNGSDWDRINLATGQSVGAGGAIDTVSGTVFRPADGRIYGFDFADNRLLRFELINDGITIGPATSLGVISGDPLSGMTALTERRIGSAFCTAAANSTGGPSQIFGYGFDSLAGSNVRLTAVELPLNAFGYFLASLTPGFVANPAGSAGNLCLSGGVGRYVGSNEVQSSGQIGAFSLDVGLTSIPQPTGFVNVMQGEVWHFQAWHRDFIGGQPTSNFTPGLELVIQ